MEFANVCDVLVLYYRREDQVTTQSNISVQVCMLNSVDSLTFQF